MTAKEYLDKIWHNERIIKNKQIEREYWMDLASGISASIGGDRVQSTKTSHPMESKVMEAIKIDEEIDNLKSEIAEIISTIQLLPTDEYDVLHKVYVQHMPIKGVYIESKSYSWVKSTHKKALEDLQKILDNREKTKTVQNCP